MNSSKTTTGELLNRYIWLANTIYSAGRITFEEINRKWMSSHWNSDGSALPLRTFHAHRKAVEDLFDIEIACDKKDSFRYYIENAEDVEKGSLRKWILGTMSVSNLLSESTQLSDRILLEEIPSGLNHLTTIMDAMGQGHAIEIVHRSFKRDSGMTLIVEPYCLKLFHQRWYALVRHPDTGNLKLYGLDRISSCRITDMEFTPGKDFEGKKFFADYFGVWVDPKVKKETVKLKVKGIPQQYLKSLPLHHSQKEVARGEDYTVFSYRLRPTKDFVNELISMAGHATVLEPVWLKEAVREEIRQMEENYKED